MAPALIAAGILGVPAALLGRAPAPPQPAPALPGISETIDVRVVNVEVVVADRGGHLVHGLTAADFRLEVDGKEVPIDYFTEVREGQAAAGAAPAGASQGAPTAPVPPGTEVARSYLVFVDNALAVGSFRDATLESLIRGLDQLRPDDRMAVVACDGGGLALLSGWTADRAALAAALRRAKGRPAGGNLALAQARSVESDMELLSSIPNDGDSSPQVRDTAAAGVRAAGSPEARTHARESMAAAATALRVLDPPPGRRSLLLLSAGWAMGAAGWQYYSPLVVAANQLGYTLFPIDVSVADASTMKSFDALARPTGGWALSGTAATAMSQIATDLGTYYWLGFSPGGADRRQHRIAVQMRRQGLTARARSSYSDIPPGSTAAARAESILLFGSAAAVPGPAPTAGRQLKVSAGTPRAAGRGKLVVDLSVEVPFALLSFTPRTGGGMVAEVPLVVAARDEKGERVNLTGHFQVSVPSSPQPGGSTHFSTRVELRRLRHHIVVGLSDAQTGDIVTGELEIRPPA